MRFAFFRATFVAAAGLAALAAQAQTAPAPVIKTDGEWRGSLGAALSATSGNTTSSSFLLSGDAYRATSLDKITFGAMANFARAKVDGENVDTSKKWSAFGQYDRNLAAQWIAFGRLGLEGDGLMDLDLRSSLSAGVGYKLIETPANLFTLYGGAGYTWDKYGSTQQIGDKYDDSFGRASLYFAEESSHKLSDTVSFKQRLDLWPGLSGDKAKLAKFSAGLGVAMSNTMNLTVGVVDNFNSKPPEGYKRNDLALFTGINIKLGAN